MKSKRCIDPDKPEQFLLCWLKHFACIVLNSYVWDPLCMWSHLLCFRDCCSGRTSDISRRVLNRYTREGNKKTCVHSMVCRHWILATYFQSYTFAFLFGENRYSKFIGQLQWYIIFSRHFVLAEFKVKQPFLFADALPMTTIKQLYLALKCLSLFSLYVLGSS